MAGSALGEADGSDRAYAADSEGSGEMAFTAVGGFMDITNDDCFMPDLAPSTPAMKRKVCNLIDEMAVFCDQPSRKHVRFNPEVKVQEFEIETYDHSGTTAVKLEGSRSANLEESAEINSYISQECDSNSENSSWSGVSSYDSMASESSAMALSEESKVNKSQGMSSNVLDRAKYSPFTRLTWIGDSGSSCHLENDDSGMYDVTIISDTIRTAEKGNTICATKMGQKKYVVRQVDGTESVKELYPVKYSPDVSNRLFSITCEIARGAKLSSDEKHNIILMYEDGSKIILDRRYMTKDGFIAGVELIPTSGEADMANLAHTLTKRKSISVNLFHEQLGHPGIPVTRSTATSRGLKIFGPTITCKSCAIGKAHQKNVPKITKREKASKPGQRISLDISSPTTKSVGGARHWLLLHDDNTGAAFSFLIKTKDLLQVRVIPWIKQLEAEFGIHVKIIRCDNAGENLAFQRASQQEGMGLKFEYTAPGTPEQNGRAERKFQTLYGRVRAMLLGSGIEGPLRKKLWAEAVNTATNLDGILVAPGEKRSPYQKFFGKGYKPIIDVTKTFGQECIVTNRTAIKSKLSNRGKPCLWMGYADDHSAGTYRLYNPATRKIILSRDVTFLGEIKETEKVKEVTAIPKLALQSKEYDEDSDDEYADMPVLINRNYVSDSDNSDNELEDEEEEHFMNYKEDVMDEEDVILEEQNPPDFNPKVARAMRNLQSSFNPEATRVLAAQLANQPVQQEQPVQSTEAGRDNPSGAAVIQDDELSNLVIEQNQITEIESKPDELIEPTKFDQAWNHENPIQRKQ